MTDIVSVNAMVSGVSLSLIKKAFRVIWDAKIVFESVNYTQARRWCRLNFDNGYMSSEDT